MPVGAGGRPGRESVPVACLLAAVLLAALPAVGQEDVAYTPSASPFQAEYPLRLAAPVALRVDITGVRVATITLTPAGEVRPGRRVKCEVAVAGDSTAAERATVSAVLLLEDGDGKSLHRIALDDFRVRSGRTIDERQTIRVPGEELQAARKVYVLIDVSF